MTSVHNISEENAFKANTLIGSKFVFYTIYDCFTIAPFVIVKRFAFTQEIVMSINVKGTILAFVHTATYQAMQNKNILTVKLYGKNIHREVK